MDKAEVALKKWGAKQLDDVDWKTVSVNFEHSDGCDTCDYGASDISISGRSSDGRYVYHSFLSYELKFTDIIRACLEMTDEELLGD